MTALYLAVYENMQKESAAGCYPQGKLFSQ